MDKEHLFISLFDSSLIGDDGAVDGEIIYSSDMFFENIHFKREWMSLYQIARKSMLVNISDAVAMGAKVSKALLNIELPKDIDSSELKELSKGFLDCAKEWGFEIIGGDTIGGDRLNIAITLISKSSNPLRRDNYSSGELIAYTGELGGSLRDLNRLFQGERVEASSRFFEPTLRGEFIYSAREYLTAGMDISDGLFCDTNKLLEINGSGLELYSQIPDEIGYSGEEYEMLITFKKRDKNRVEKIARESQTPLTIFGEIRDDNRFRFECRSHHF